MEPELEKQLRATYADMSHEGRLNEIIRLQKLLSEITSDLNDIGNAIAQLVRVR